MVASSSSLLVFRILLLILSLSGSARGLGGFGINYGQIANNLPSPTRVASLLSSLNVTRVKLYDADPNVLSAFSGTGVSFVIGLGNELLAEVTDPVKAQSWVAQHLSPHLPGTKITSILVGNEVFGSNDTNLMAYLLPAMQAVYTALVNVGLADEVIVTTAHSLTILGTSFPPSAGAFKPSLAEYIQPLLNFHAEIKSPFLINAYPYFAYKDSPGEVPIEYVLFEPNLGSTDGNTNLHYDNMLYAQVDAVYSAMKAMGHDGDIEVRISETGWPSKGDENEAGANPTNAGLYHRNLIQRVSQREGTPARPSVPIDVYVFALFNENMKPGPGSERNYGLFYPDGTPVYDIGVRGNLPELAMYPGSACSTTVLSLFNLVTLLVASFICL